VKAPLESWDRRWWWLLILAITVGNVIRGTDGWRIAILAFAAGAAYRKRFPGTPSAHHNDAEGFPPMPGPMAPRSHTPPSYPHERPQR
jgi:hypothetical protein